MLTFLDISIAFICSLISGLLFAFYIELVAPQNSNLAISAWSLGNSWKKHKETPFTGCFITWRTKNKYKEAERVGLQIDLLVEEMEQKIT